MPLEGIEGAVEADSGLPLVAIFYSLQAQDLITCYSRKQKFKRNYDPRQKRKIQ